MTSSGQIGAMVLAAGRGHRLGEPKWQLEIGGRSFLDHVLQALRGAGLGRIVCVVGSEFPDSVRRLFPDVEFVVNPQPDEDMLQSVKIGLTPLTDVDGILIAHVDHPLVRESTYRMLTENFMEHPDCVVKPVYETQSGHPIIVPKPLFGEIQQAGEHSPLNAVIQQSAVEQLRVDCNDPGILNNINTADRHPKS